MPNSEDLLAQYQSDLEASDFDEEKFGNDRRHFVFLSLAAAAATTLGADPARAQTRASTLASAARAGTAQQRPAPVPLGNGEPPAIQFQPYPPGTGALMEKVVRERGADAFKRGSYNPLKWSSAA